MYSFYFLCVWVFCLHVFLCVAFACLVPLESKLGQVLWLLGLDFGSLVKCSNYSYYWTISLASRMSVPINFLPRPLLYFKIGKIRRFLVPGLLVIVLWICCWWLLLFLLCSPGLECLETIRCLPSTKITAMNNHAKLLTTSSSVLLALRKKGMGYEKFI